MRMRHVYGNISSTVVLRSRQHPTPVWEWPETIMSCYTRLTGILLYFYIEFSLESFM